MSTAHYQHAVTNPLTTINRRLALVFLLLLTLIGIAWPVNSYAAQRPDDNTQRREVVFIEGDVTDYPSLVRDFNPSTQKFILDPGANGLQEIARLLMGHAPVDAIHLVSHGASATLQLGTLSLTPENLPHYSDVLGTIGRALKPGGEILLYGCDIAAGTNGPTLVAALADATGANVAASTNPTGPTALGGDWVLEYRSGKITTAGLVSQSYPSLLAAGTMTFSSSPGVATVTDGMGGSTDIPGITIQISSNLGQPWTLETPYTQNAIASDYGNSTPSSLITIKSSSTTVPFWFKSIFVVDYGGANINVEGFRNTVSTGSVNLTTNVGPWEFTFNSSGALTASIFNNVDEVRITPQSGGQMWIALNNIGIDNAVIPPPTATTGSASSVTATGATLNGTINDNGSDTTVTFDYGTTAGYGTNVAATTGGTVTNGSGSTAVAVTLAGLSCNTTYHFRVNGVNSAGTSNGGDATFTTSKCPQTITFNNPGPQNFGTTPTLSATSTSGLTPTFTSSTTGVCTITSGGALTFVTTGTCTINADQAGNATYAAATSVPQSFSVSAVVPGAPTIGTASAGDTQVSVTFSAPGSNGGAAITGYTATSNPTGLNSSGCTASPCTVTGLTNGTAYTFTVTATNSAGTGSASAASNSATPKANQTITFANPGAQNFGTAPTLSASSTSGLTVTFSSSTTGVCTITSGGALTFVTAGTCTIDADQAG
ncbi:MAG: DUF4347 domain-containing protein, partial [Rhodoferax sp.]